MPPQPPALAPPRRDLFGIQVSVTDYSGVVRAVFSMLEQGQVPALTALAVHGLMLAVNRPEVRQAVNGLDMATPDGQPVRAALNLLYKAGLADRVYGPFLTLRLAEEAARRGVPVYLYGSRLEVVRGMAENLVRRYPALRVVGVEPSLFRPLTEQEDRELVERVNASGAGLVFVGLGCPLQELFVFQHKGRFRAAQAAVGAAFDFISGNKAWAPAWVQAAGLEWLFRLLSEPGRLWKRYLLYNSQFLWRLGLALAARGFRGKRA